MYDKYIDKFMPSKNMSEYLKTQELTPKQITSLIFNSPKSIECKLKSLESLTKEADDDNLHYWCNQYINAIKYARSGTKNWVQGCQAAFCYTVRLELVKLLWQNALLRNVDLIHTH